MTYIQDTYDEDEDDAPRSRKKTDIFHRFQSLPLGKTNPHRPTFSKMLIHLTFQFDKDDYANLERYLQPSMRYKPIDGDKYTDELMDIFYHKREWWRQRCRMYTPKAIEHAKRLEQVIQAIKSDPELSSLYDKDMEDYFNMFMKAIMRGEFEELSDVCMFLPCGHDSHGFQLYFRMRGTVRTENLHSKMHNAIGPWGIGARTAHMLLVLICYRYNINTDVTRCGGYNFGHCEYYLIDRIQNRVQELFNVLIWPKHKNVTNFKGKEGFISVGIGPLCYDEKYVTKGEPAEVLSGDLRFIAKQQGLKYPLHHLGWSRKELKMYNDFMASVEKPTMRQMEKLSERYKEQSNGTSVLPKLPTMLQSYQKTWEKNTAIKVSRRSLHSNTTNLMRKLWGSKTDHAEVYNIPMTDYQTHDDAQVETASQTSESATTHTNANIANDSEEQIEFAIGDSAEEGEGIGVQLFVPPAQAPFQTNYIASLEPINQRERRCACYPLCKKMADECGGWNSVNNCIYWGVKLKNDPVLLASMKSQKRKMRNQRCAEQRRMKRQQVIDEN